MSKRRCSSVAEDDTDDVGETSSTVISRKKKKLDPSEMCQLLYDSIRNQKKEDGVMLCDTFIRVPKRRQEPTYYDIVNNPIDLLRIQQKLKTDSYEDVDDLTVDVELLVNNAKAFYNPDSDEYADACQLWAFFQANKQKLLDSSSAQQEDNSNATAVETKRPVRVGRKPRTSAADTDDASEGSKDEDMDMYEELFVAVMTATDPADGRALHTEFQLLPSKRLYPDYYDVIEHPIDLKLIATKIQTQAYLTLVDMERDLLQMVKNACAFNEPGSQIYKDAKTLKKIFTNRRLEIESGKYKPVSRPKRRGASLSAITAALKEEPESSDDELMEDMSADGGPLWQLFDQIYNTANSSEDHATTDPGAPLGESLWKLPNRRFHPEYYVQIKKPISMIQIRNKLKKGAYSNVTEMTADLYLMIDNGKKAYPNTHKVHKDALKMQKVLNQKLITYSMSSDESEEEEDNASANSSPSTPVPRKKGRPRIHNLGTSPTNTPVLSTPQMSTTKAPRLPPSNIANNPVVKKKLLGLTKYLTEYTVAGRRPMALFMEKPSKKQYPDYYDVIEHPIDMTTIENQIKYDRYSTLDDIVADYRLMFANCRKYNEEGSTIYEDANLLEKALNEKMKEFSGLTVIRVPPKIPKVGRKSSNHLENKLRQLYDAIREYRDPKTARQLCIVFMKLPSKSDYPDYYDIIKSPVDMEKVAVKIKQHSYETLEELAADFMLMFENACKYNEPDSQIYKDALILQQLCIQKKQSLRDNNDDNLPDTQLAVQDLLMSLFTTLYNHQDEEGRCFSDSLAELPEYDEQDGIKNRAISLDLIKRRLDKGLYKRLDLFQEDVFSCLDRARRLSRTDSQVFEDSIELQSFFIKQRDELCKNGETLTSPALNYSPMHLSAAVEAVRQTKLLQEEQEHEAEMEMAAAINGESMTIDQKVYSPGDFVYFESPDQKIPGVAYIERLWTNQDGVKMMYGNLFLRPHETYHVTTRKFLEQELFKSDIHQAIPLSQVRNKCYVMFIKDYIKLRPETFPDRDVFVCESRYNSRGRSFKKIKNWPFVRAHDPIKLSLREIPLEPKRIMSVFKERVEKHKGELAELQLQEALVEKEKPNVVTYVTGGEEGCTYYEQYNTVCSGVIKLGDFVYVATEGGKQSIAQIEMIWETREGKSFFRGPWLLTASEVPNIESRAAYQQEVFLSTVQETSPLIAIVGRCCVLEANGYSHARPTEIPEADVYICEYIFDETKKELRKIQANEAGLRKFSHSQLVTADEMYYYKRTVQPQKAADTDATKNDSITTVSSELLGVTEDSMDGGRSSVGSDFVSTPIVASNLFASGKKLKMKKQVITGYILYSREVRKTFVQENPEAKFGDISRLVGTEWRSLSSSERQVWEERASKINEETARRLDEMRSASPMSALSDHIPNQVFECGWDKCDWQFEDMADCQEHAIAESTGHVQTHCKTTADAEFICLWRGCIRLRKQAPAFPHLVRLVKHVREVHINKSNGRILLPNERSKNYVPSTKKQTLIPAGQQPQIGGSLSGTAMKNAQQQYIVQNPNIPNPQPNHSTFQIVTAAKPAQPMFVPVPPRPQRILHSEAYIKYIEGLQNERFITPWEKTIRAQESTVPRTDPAKLPLNWIGHKAQDNPERVVSALWQLREFMMKDVLLMKQDY